MLKFISYFLCLSPRYLFFTPLVYKTVFLYSWISKCALLLTTLFQLPSQTYIFSLLIHRFMSEKFPPPISKHIFFNSIVVCIVSSCALHPCILHNNSPAFALFLVWDYCSCNFQAKGLNHTCIIFWSFWCAFAFIFLKLFCVMLFSLFCSQPAWILSPRIIVVWSLLWRVLWAFPEKQCSDKICHIWLFHTVKCYFCSFLCVLIRKPHFMPIMPSTWLLLIFPSPGFPPLPLISLYKFHDECSWSREREATRNVYNSYLA